MTNYQPLRPLMQSQSPALGSTPLIPNRTGLMKPASPVRVRDSISHLPFLTLQSGGRQKKQQETQLPKAVWRHKMERAKWSLIFLRHIRWIVEMNEGLSFSLLTPHNPLLLLALEKKKQTLR